MFVLTIERPRHADDADIRHSVYSIHLLCDFASANQHHMVDVAQLVEPLIVVQEVASSSLVVHPNKIKASR